MTLSLTLSVPQRLSQFDNYWFCLQFDCRALMLLHVVTAHHNALFSTRPNTTSSNFCLHHRTVVTLLRRRHVLHPVVPRHIDLLAAVGRNTNTDEREPLLLGLNSGGVVVPLAVLVLVLALVGVGVRDAATYDGTGCQLCVTTRQLGPSPGAQQLCH